jgi:plasmid stabilization system protein ParE
MKNEEIEDVISRRAYIAEDNPAAARRTVQHIRESIEQLLPDNPRIGRAGRVPARANLSFPGHPTSFPIGFSEPRSKSYASIMRRDAGLTVFDQLPCPHSRGRSRLTSRNRTPTTRRMCRTRDDARANVFDYIERFYNPKRRHSMIGYFSPMQF